MDKTVFLPQDCFTIKGRGVVVTGVLQSGRLAKGMKMTVNGKEAEVLGIEVQGESGRDAIQSNDPKASAVGVLVSGISGEDIKPVTHGGQPLVFI